MRQERPPSHCPDARRPVTSDAAPEAVGLLEFLYGISGKQTLAGQHCAPLVGSTRLVTVHGATGRYPALFGQDFGFSAAGTWDGINFRQRIVDEAIRRHHEGFVITLMWHAVPPTRDEPVEFRGGVQSRLSDDEWRELTTPGTGLHGRWRSQVDVVAWFLRQLREARVPVLWRPYHEMNGRWFWWGGRAGDAGYRALYRMLFERLTGFHGLDNLLWVFNANELNEHVGDYADFYPGDDLVDILATDVYHSGFLGEDYDRLLALGGGRPIALGEVGALPTVEILRKQPRWAWFMAWGDVAGRWHERDAIRELYGSPEVLTHGDLPWVDMDEPRTHYPVLG
ncbi:MAG: glycosyl hydrolase family 26 [Planctomycetes bacterium SM23_32]|nr:MAG: glycosyl hydrolase family 26 [Planctomycetes bacterium SM23_32]